jgi:NADH:ubiquinone oxidoreductase subunit 3 (subunit A)
MILPSRFIVLAMLIVVAAGYGLPVEIDSQPLMGLVGLVGGVVGFIALNLVGYAIERRKAQQENI